jgi:hypothetical protein
MSKREILNSMCPCAGCGTRIFYQSRRPGLGEKMGGGNGTFKLGSLKSKELLTTQEQRTSCHELQT